MLNFIILLLALGLCFNSIAQQSSVTTGGLLENSNGSVSFSVGQVIYSNKEISSARENQGVQQPYFALVELEDKLLDAGITVFPNPTNTIVYIRSKDFNLFQADYRVFSPDGRLLKYGQLDYDNKINLSEMSPGCYVLKIDHSDGYKSLNIIKY